MLPLIPVIGAAVCVYGVCRLIQAALIAFPDLKDAGNGRLAAPMLAVTSIGSAILFVTALYLMGNLLLGFAHKSPVEIKSGPVKFYSAS